VTGAYTGTIAVFDLPSRSWKKFYKATHAGISSIAYNKQSNQFLASSYDGNVYPIQ
jgi:hypothetical protein